MLYDLDDSINSTVAKFIEENCKEGDREQTGLDPRAFGKFWYCYEGIFIYEHARGRLDYYGGFEYVDPDHVKQYGDYVMYSSEDSRVAEVIDSIVDSFEEMADA